MVEPIWVVVPSLWCHNYLVLTIRAELCPPVQGAVGNDEVLATVHQPERFPHWVVAGLIIHFAVNLQVLTHPWNVVGKHDKNRVSHFGLHILYRPLIIADVANIEYPAVVALQEVATPDAKKNAVAVSDDVVELLIVI